jgi:PilZ domain
MTEVKPGSGTDAASERRRSHRLQLTMPVIVRGQISNHPFTEEAQTVAVNANGCMVRLAARLVRSQPVSIVNPKTAEELPCKVTYVGQSDGKKTEIGLEFAESSPLFWRIAFPPEDWDPAERKRPMASPPPKRHP